MERYTLAHVGINGRDEEQARQIASALSGWTAWGTATPRRRSWNG